MYRRLNQCIKTFTIKIFPRFCSHLYFQRLSKMSSEDKAVPFYGPSSKIAWTGGIKPTTSFEINGTDDSSMLPNNKTWIPYDMGTDMAIRSAGTMTIPEWFSMRYWEKNQFGLLFALSARVPDFAISAYWSVEGASENELGIVILIGDERFTNVVTATSKTKAKQACAGGIISDACIWPWIKRNYSNAPCDQYLR